MVLILILCPLVELESVNTGDHDLLDRGVSTEEQEAVLPNSHLGLSTILIIIYKQPPD